MNPSDALKVILSSLKDEDIALFTTGFISRRAHAIKDRKRNFYMLGSMGLLSSLGLGIALNKPDVKVVVVEGDGSALMSLGSLGLVGFLYPANFYHIVLDNQCYESTGGQPSITTKMDLSEVAKACGYKQISEAKGLGCLKAVLKLSFQHEGPAFFLVEVESFHKVGPRIPLSPEEIKERLREECKP